ncbi:MAG TPA: hypothetical protein VLB44_22145 [Kofleriaceae bacterium]|nr:hypothetical protein [Kofleriaceae bacterium]
MKNLLIALTLASTAACGVDSAPDGLELDVQTQNRIIGDFVQDNVGLAFDFRRDPSIDQHYAILETEAGQHLITQATAGDYKLINVLDGRFTVAGPINGEKTMTGDPAALQELLDTSEYKLLGPLHTALSERGVDADLQAMMPTDIASFMWMPGMMR